MLSKIPGLLVKFLNLAEYSIEGWKCDRCKKKELHICHKCINCSNFNFCDACFKNPVMKDTRCDFIHMSHSKNHITLSRQLKLIVYDIIDSLCTINELFKHVWFKIISLNKVFSKLKL